MARFFRIRVFGREQDVDLGAVVRVEQRTDGNAVLVYDGGATLETDEPYDQVVSRWVEARRETCQPSVRVG